MHLKKDGIPIERDTANVESVTPDGDNCHIHFFNGETIKYSYGLKDFERVYCIGTELMRAHRKYVINFTKVVKAWCYIAITENKKKFDLGRKAYKKVKAYLIKKYGKP